MNFCQMLDGGLGLFRGLACARRWIRFNVLASSEEKADKKVIKKGTKREKEKYQVLQEL